MEKEPKILIIHPEDSSTDFLQLTYQGNPKLGERGIIIRDVHVPNSRLKDLIKMADIVVMMGHGTEHGLVTPDARFMINSSHVYLLREKLCVGIWCNANVFFEKYKLKGLHTGMIISEVDEALHYCIPATHDEINDSNYQFANAIRQKLRLDNLQQSRIDIQLAYQIKSPVTEFNNANIFYAE